MEHGEKILFGDPVCDNIGEIDLNERIVLSWVQLSAILKSSRITQGMPYNEAIVMLLLYHEYKSTGNARLPLSTVIAKTKMLKSLANRTINSLETKGFLIKAENPEDKRAIDLVAIPERAELFMDVHKRSLLIADEIRNAIGNEDAETFIRIVNKIVSLSALSKSIKRSTEKNG